MTFEKRYSILLDDQAIDPDFVKGKDYHGTKVYGNALEVQNQLCNLFGSMQINQQKLLGNTNRGSLQTIIGEPSRNIGHTTDRGIRKYQEGDIGFYSTQDKEAPNRPEYMGHIRVKGTKKNIQTIEALLETELPGIGQYGKEIAV